MNWFRQQGHARGDRPDDSGRGHRVVGLAEVWARTGRFQFWPTSPWAEGCALPRCCSPRGMPEVSLHGEPQREPSPGFRSRVRSDESPRSRRTGAILLSSASRASCWLRERGCWWPREALLSTLGLELDLLTLEEVAPTGADDSREVREDIGRAVVGSDEAEALLGVEPFDSASGHVDIPFQVLLGARARRPYLPPLRRRRRGTCGCAGHRGRARFRMAASNCGGDGAWGNADETVGIFVAPNGATNYSSSQPRGRDSSTPQSRATMDAGRAPRRPASHHRPQRAGTCR